MRVHKDTFSLHSWPSWQLELLSDRCLTLSICMGRCCIRAQLDARVDEHAPECFICTESIPTPARSECLCTYRFMHETCFLKMLNARNDVNCAVCAAPYRNVHLTKRRVLKAFSPCGAVATLLCALFMLVTCWINTWVALVRLRTVSIFLWAIQSLMGLVIFFAIFLIARICTNSGGWKAVCATGVCYENVFLVCKGASLPIVCELTLAAEPV